MKQNIEIVALIYKSLDYLDLIYKELKSDRCKLDGWDVGVRLVLNDATNEIIEGIKDLDIEHTIYTDNYPHEYYLNRVYRCWNFAGMTSKYDNICFVNSDMVFSDEWLENLLKHHDGHTIPCSRLVESGKMTSGLHGISKNFGKTPKDINLIGFNEYANKIKTPQIHLGGLFMPCVFDKVQFIESGMYPEGNIYSTGVGNFGDPFVMSGDAYFFKRLNQIYGLNHVTVYDSIVYHIQEGEMDS